MDSASGQDISRNAGDGEHCPGVGVGGVTRSHLSGVGPTAPAVNESIDRAAVTVQSAADGPR